MNGEAPSIWVVRLGSIRVTEQPFKSDTNGSTQHRILFSIIANKMPPPVTGIRDRLLLNMESPFSH